MLNVITKEKKATELQWEYLQNMLKYLTTVCVFFFYSQ